MVLRVLAHKALDDIGKALSELACGLVMLSIVLWVRVSFAVSGEVGFLACGEICEKEPFDIIKGLGLADFSGLDLQEEVSPNTVCG